MKDSLKEIYVWFVVLGIGVMSGFIAGACVYYFFEFLKGVI